MTIDLQQHLMNLRASGELQGFNAEYQRRRNEAKAEGKGFMTYRVALTRLQQAIVAHHMAKR